MDPRLNVFAYFVREAVLSKEVEVQKLIKFLKVITYDVPKSLLAFKEEVDQCLNKHKEEFRFIDKESPGKKLEYLLVLWRFDKDFYSLVRKSLSELCFGNHNLLDYQKYY